MLLRMTSVFGLLALFSTPLMAQTEFPPPAGKGRLVVVASGMSGPEHYATVSRAIAALGYDVVLFDGNQIAGTKGEGLKTAITEAEQMPHALPGKPALVGFSMGGGTVLGYGSAMSDQVAGVVVWYPATSTFRDIQAFANARLKVPVLMFAGESDTYRGCCLVDTARTIDLAAKAAGKPFELVTYPGVDHDFVEGGTHYNSAAYKDALSRTATKLTEFLGQ